MEDIASSFPLPSFHMLLLSFLSSSLLDELICSFTFLGLATVHRHLPSTSCWRSASSESLSLWSVDVLHEQHSHCWCWNLINGGGQDWRRLTWVQLQRGRQVVSPELSLNACSHLLSTVLYLMPVVNASVAFLQKYVTRICLSVCNRMVAVICTMLTPEALHCCTYYHF